jgi:hypothetical protein
MSNVIQFLAAMGGNPDILSAAEYSAIVSALDVDAAQRQALMDRDQCALARLLGGRAEMRCLVWPVEASA